MCVNCTIPAQYYVGIDNNGFKPVSFNEVEDYR